MRRATEAAQSVGEASNPSTARGMGIFPFAGSHGRRAMLCALELDKATARPADAAAIEAPIRFRLKPNEDECDGKT